MAAGGKTSKVKLALAMAGAGFCVAFVMMLGGAIASRPTQRGPSELALHPDQQDRILAERKATEFQEQLGLDEDQTAAVASLLQKAREDMAAAMRTAPQDRAARLAAGMQYMEKMNTQVEALLDGEQRAKYRELREDRRGRLFELLEAFESRRQSGS